MRDEYILCETESDLFVVQGQEWVLGQVGIWLGMELRLGLYFELGLGQFWGWGWDQGWGFIINVRVCANTSSITFELPREARWQILIQPHSSSCFGNSGFDKTLACFERLLKEKPLRLTMFITSFVLMGDYLGASICGERTCHIGWARPILPSL